MGYEADIDVGLRIGACLPVKQVLSTYINKLLCFNPLEVGPKSFNQSLLDKLKLLFPKRYLREQKFQLVRHGLVETFWTNFKGVKTKLKGLICRVEQFSRVVQWMIILIPENQLSTPNDKKVEMSKFFKISKSMKSC